MVDSPAVSLTVVQPGEGREGLLVGIGVVFKLFGKDTGGQVSIVEHPFPVGAIIPPHIHTREDKFSIVTEGEIGYRSGDSEVVLRAGGYIIKPRQELHTMWNAGKSPARMIEVITPAGFEHFFWEMADMLAGGGPPDPAAIGELADRYGLILALDPPWLGNLIQRYDLPRPAFLPPIVPG